MRVLLMLSVSVALSTGCGPGSTATSPAKTTPLDSGVATAAAPGQAPAGSGSTPAAPDSTASTQTPAAPPALPGGHGLVVVLDPGHNGGNATHPTQINQLVPAGRGQTKACNTTGTASNDGYSEHAFTWDVANRVSAELSAHGFQVVLTRHDDTGVGPCVNERAAIGNQANAAAVVSIHADGSDVAGARGFHVEYSSPPLNAAQGEPSVKLAAALRDAVSTAGFPISNYLGSHGLLGRADLGGLNLSERPTALIECGNMRNATDAAVLESPSGRQRYADAIATAIMAYLAH